MCSYNKVNGTYACENEYILNTIVKGRLSFKGFITSDWRATHSTAKNANNGLGK
jgi:beta-glucosidase